MQDKEARGHGTTSERIIETVASWSHVTTGDGPFGSPAFYVENRQIGHIHLDELPSVDVTFPEPLRKRLLAEGHTNDHPMNSRSEQSKATLFVIESENDVDNAVWLFRLSYLVHVSLLQKRGEPDLTLNDIDVRGELDELAPSDAVRRAFEAITGDVW